ncbi:MAG: hypothetical protein AAGF81_17515 [Pseudomonadota bacterium]
MPSSIPEYRLHPVNRVELRLVDEAWPFAAAKKTQIADHWQALTAENPTLFNGNILLMVRGGLNGDVFKADLIEVDYASFITWRDWGWCDETVHDCYGSAIVVSSEGALVMGRMGQHTVNAGKVYPPGGSLTREDLLPGGAVDLTASIARELEEETGLKASDAKAGRFFMAAFDQRIAIGQVLHFSSDADALAARTRAHISSEDLPELSEAVIIRSMADLDPNVMPPHARAFSSALLENAPVAR